MSIIEYNLRIIICIGVLLVGLGWIVKGNIAAKDKTHRIVGIICAVLIPVFVFTLFAFVSYNDEPVAGGTVDEVAVLGSLGGLLDTYDVSITQDNGEKPCITLLCFLRRHLRSRLIILKKATGYRFMLRDYLILCIGLSKKHI